MQKTNHIPSFGLEIAAVMLALSLTLSLTVSQAFAATASPSCQHLTRQDATFTSGQEQKVISQLPIDRYTSVSVTVVSFSDSRSAVRADLAFSGATSAAPEHIVVAPGKTVARNFSTDSSPSLDIAAFAYGPHGSASFTDYITVNVDGCK